MLLIIESLIKKTTNLLPAAANPWDTGMNER